MIYIDIEFVDAGDNGRAPIAAAMARRYFHERNPAVVVDSSGTRVNFLDTLDDSQLSALVEPYFSVLSKCGIITNAEAESLRQGQDIRRIIKNSLTLLTNQESGRVRQILQERNLAEYLNLECHPRQTTARKEAELILALSDENYREVNGIYAPTGKKQEIRILGKFEDPLFASLEEHRKIADEIEQATIATLERLL